VRQPVTRFPWCAETIGGARSARARVGYLCCVHLTYVDHIEGRGLEMFAGALALEGVVAKDASSPCIEIPLVTWHWQKIKNREYKRKEPVEFHPQYRR